VLHWQKGDSFDSAILLCSILTGSGYDALCIYGHAPRFITTVNQELSETPNQYLDTDRVEKAVLMLSLD